MKFCKSLQRVAAISDPSYAPYWTNYKLLKKLIKAISGRDAASVGTSLSEDVTDHTSLASPQTSPRLSGRTSAAAAAASPSEAPLSPAAQREKVPVWEVEAENILSHNTGIRNNPREVAFFRLVHAEVKKAQNFFDKVERECLVRTQVVSVGMEILKKPQACMVRDRWSVISRAIFFLYRDLLLLETFAIMTYFSFSKILKKHDKVTGYTTRDSFMVNIVNKANFTNYPGLIDLIAQCQALYSEASEKLTQDLHEDERLFLDMVNEWNTRNRDASSAGSGEVTDGLPPQRAFAATRQTNIPSPSAAALGASTIRRTAASAAAASKPSPSPRRQLLRSLPLASSRKRASDKSSDSNSTVDDKESRRSRSPPKKRPPK